MAASTLLSEASQEEDMRMDQILIPAAVSPKEIYHPPLPGWGCRLVERFGFFHREKSTSPG